MGLSACAIKSDRLGLAGFAGAAAGVKNETDYSFVQANQIARADAIDTFQLTKLRPFISAQLAPETCHSFIRLLDKPIAVYY